MQALPENPWLTLPTRPPFVLPMDEPWIETFNESASPSFKVHTNLIPEPFFGPFGAPIVVLLLNPGVDEADANVHTQEFLRDLLIQNVRRTEPQSPHVHISEDAKHPGALWWRRATSQVTEQFGVTRVAKSLLAVEFFPYHSKSFAHGPLRLPSQDFSFALVRAAISRGALVVVARGLEHWVGAIPNLAQYAGVVRASNLRRFSLSRGNLKQNFDRLCCAIERTDA